MSSGPEAPIAYVAIIGKARFSRCFDSLQFAHIRIKRMVFKLVSATCCKSSSGPLLHQKPIDPVHFAEMLLFSGFHIRSGDPSYRPVIYSLVVAAQAAFVAFGRLVL
jgi:hypothetical protein